MTRRQLIEKLIVTIGIFLILLVLKVCQLGVVVRWPWSAVVIPLMVGGALAQALYSSHYRE